MARHGSASSLALQMQHYFRTTRWVRAQPGSFLSVGTNCRIRHLTDEEARTLVEQIRKRDPFSRHRGPNDFYYQRTAALVGHTVVEFFGGGHSDLAILGSNAVTAENVVVASLMLVGERQVFVRKLIGDKRAYLDIHLTTVGTNLKVSSTSEKDFDPIGLALGKTDSGRYSKNGFSALYEFAISAQTLASRIRLALRWLMESRTDASESSALVKTATALESLLIIGKEPTTRALCERSAYLLSDDPEERRRISRSVKKFYGYRGDIVHGKHPAKPSILSKALEFGDRLTVLLTLVLANSTTAWRNAEQVRAYCDAVRWGDQPYCHRPWDKRYLTSTLDRLM